MLQVTFSSECDVLCSFTRDYDLIKAKISQLDFITNTCYPPVIQTINNLVHSEWSNSVTCQVSYCVFSIIECLNYYLLYTLNYNNNAFVFH